MKQKLTLIKIVCIALFGFYCQAKAQSGKTSMIQFSSSENVSVLATAIDTGNRIISVGDFTDTAFLQNTNRGFSGKDSFDAFVICTDEQGNVIWKDIFGEAYSTWATNVVCDNSGNYFVTGYFEKGFTYYGVHFDSTSYYNAFLMKLDHNGKVIWGKSYSVSSKYISGSGVFPTLACDGDGSLYYSILILNPLEIDKQVFNDPGQQGGLLVKFDKNGKLIWGKTMLIQNAVFLQYVSSTALIADHFGHLYLGGYISKGTAFWGGSNLPGTLDTTSSGLFFAKIDANTGDMLWIHRGISGELTRFNTGVNGSVFATGYFWDTLKILGQNYPLSGVQDGLVMNFDTTGKIKWLQHFGSQFEPEYPAGLCMDHADYVYVGGVYDVPVKLGARTLFSTRSRDCYVIRFDKYGNYVGSISSKAIAATSYTGMDGVMIDSHNKLFVSGYLTGQTNFGGDTVSCFGPVSSFIWGVASSFTGIEPLVQQSIKGFKLYPNPLNGNVLNLEMDKDAFQGNVEVICMDETGKLIFTGTIEKMDVGSGSSQLLLPPIKPGLYFIKLVSDDGISVQKFIKD